MIDFFKLTRILSQLFWYLILGSFLLMYINCNSFLSTSESASSLEVGAQTKNPFLCQDKRDTNQKSMQRLDRIEYRNSIKAVVGDKVLEQINAEIETLPSERLLKSLNDFSSQFQENHLTAYEQVASKVMSLIAKDQTMAASVFGDCTNSKTVTDGCVDTSIRKIGKLAFRRPLTEDEVLSYRNNIFSLGENVQEGLSHTVYAMLLSPYFLIKVELGDKSQGSDSLFNLSQYELASRLSYLIWSAPPDKILYELAENKTLSSAPVLREQVTRMLQDVRAKKKLNEFFEYYLAPRFYSASSFSSEFLKDIDLASLNSEFNREMYEYIDHIVWAEHGSFKELVSSNISFARTPATAEIYGHAVVQGEKGEPMSGRRKGLLMRMPVLAGEGNETHPILRGVKFKIRYLCGELGFPSGVSLDNSEFFTDQARKDFNTRFRTTEITKSESCMACHSAINPFGFAFENIDSIGRIRQFETAYSTEGIEIATHPIDTFVERLPLGLTSVQVAVKDGFELIDELAKSPDAHACFSKQLYRFYQKQSESDQDNCQLANVFDSLLTNGSEQKGSIADALVSLFSHESTIVRRVE